MSVEYRDRFITCTPDEIEIRGYYFPWGTKRIRYSRINGVQRINLGALTGRGRIWGTGNPRRWVNFDPARPRKRIGLVLDVGAAVKPLITPDDPQAVMDAIATHAGPDVFSGGRSSFI